jgi:DNA-binding transcriptional ArsR family regulator
MAEKKTVSIASDPAFLDELSDYLDALSNPTRLQILKYIEHEPKEVNEIAAHIGTTYANTKKHLDRLIATSLIRREAGFSRETSKGILPVWKYSLAGGGLEMLLKNLGVFSSITFPMGHTETEARLKSVRSAVLGRTGEKGPVLYLVEEIGGGKAFFLRQPKILVGRIDPDNPVPDDDRHILLPEHYRAVTRVTKPHATITCRDDIWYIEDNGSTGGTYINAKALPHNRKHAIGNGDVIDLALGDEAARFLFVSDE